MKIDNLEKEIAIAISAATKSGKLLSENRISLNHSMESSAKDIKLKADIESEFIIKRALSDKSNFPILAEESGKSQNDLGDIFWVVDPLDGTANYNRDIPICCVSIGLVYKMNPIAGIIYDFYNDDLYVGNNQEKKATRNNENISISNISEKKEGILVTGLPHQTDFSDIALKNLIHDMQLWKKVRMIGSAAMAACYVASGKADLYSEKGVFIWDIIAGAAIVESAGGVAKISDQNKDYQVDVLFSNSLIQT